MAKIFNSDMSLTEDGVRIFLDFNYNLKQIMFSDEVNDMTESEIRVLGTHLHTVIGNAITNRISQKKQVLSDLSAMTDDEYEAYLKEKYGETWTIHALEIEERQRIPHHRLQEIVKAHNLINIEILDFAKELKVE